MKLSKPAGKTAQIRNVFSAPTVLGKWLKISFCGLVLLASVETAPATPPIAVDNPIGFFTNVAARLLTMEMNLDLNHIQVYPTNQYTPAVHRLLQVTANIFDATTTNYYPSVFRPVFSQDASGSVFITGFTNLSEITDPANDPQFAAPVDAASVQGTSVAANVYGIPWIIGAKKGFPNFNVFTMESIFSIARKLVLTRTNTTVTFISNPTAYTFAQQFTIGLTNYLGVECWNSYRADYTNAQQMEIFATDQSILVLTNDEGVFLPASSYNANSITNALWPGYGPGTIPNQSSFLVPLLAGNEMVPNLVYTFDPAQPFTTDPNASFTNVSVVPHWGLLVTNRLRVAMLEHNHFEPSGIFHVIDYVQLIGPNSSHDLNTDIQQLYDIQPLSPGYHAFYDDQWDTNIVNIGGVQMVTGLYNQFTVSADLTPITLSPYWEQQDPASVTNQMAVFRGFLGLARFPGMSSQSYNMGKTYLSLQAPYTPVALVSYITKWGANYPLVHYLASDLTDLNTSSAPQKYAAAFTFNVLNDRCMPWGGTPSLPGPSPSFNSVNRFNYTIKDPLVYSSDAWNFPSGQPLNASWLGQIHRGTPWQTIYLKPCDILQSVGGLNTWTIWTGDPDAADASAMSPAQDWHLASLLASMFNTNDFRSLVSVNDPDPNAWLVLLDGLTALTNAAPGVFDAILISSNSPQASIIASAVQAARNGQPNGFFRDAGDILSVSQLNTASPFLNIALSDGVSDAAYEELPGQLLSLVRANSIGSAASAGGRIALQFTGYDGHEYAIQASSDLVNWNGISTNSPLGGILNMTNPPSNAGRQFFRSVLMN